LCPDGIYRIRAERLLNRSPPMTGPAKSLVPYRQSVSMDFAKRRFCCDC
jgi:hypothetical protein